jgi:uncharacterized protein YbbK (DUF523 family)
MRKKKVAVSACILGELCRYDGATKKIDAVVEAFKGWEVVPFCPEAPVLGTPRQRISIVDTETGHRVIGDEDGREVTEALKEQTQRFIDAHPDLEKIVLKSKSPSCGLGTTPILTAEGALLGYGNGIAAEMLLEAFPDADIIDEHCV